MSKIELVIFDCDGVLLDSEIVAAAAELSVYSEFGIKLEPQEFCERFAGLDSYAVKAGIEQELGHELPERVIAETRAAVNEKVVEDARMIKGADAVLDQLDQARCVCSNSPPERLKKALGKVGLYDKFRPYVFSAQDSEPHVFKPKPDIVLRALSEFELEPRQAVVLEDSVHGIQAAKNAGTRVIGFTGASHTYPTHADELIDAGAETVISRLTDLPSVIEAFSSWGGIA
jgi:HAD superfamily hydrolase (TIGR01509 family)